jgi:hypothetical protein
MRIVFMQYLLIILCVIIFALLGCSSSKMDANISKDEYPVKLYISSQNSHVDPVNIVVTLDFEKKLVENNFYCGTGHNISEYKFTMTKGSHQFVVESNNGDAGMDVIFTIDKPTSLSLSYWGKNHFQLNISNGDFIFM